MKPKSKPKNIPRLCAVFVMLSTAQRTKWFVLVLTVNCNIGELVGQLDLVVGFDGPFNTVQKDVLK